MSSHLLRRGGIWWARLAVPERLRAAAGRRQFIQSSKTHELQIAKLVTAVLVASWRRQRLALQFVAMPYDVLKIVDGLAAFVSGGHLPLEEAADLFGIGQNGSPSRPSATWAAYAVKLVLTDLLGMAQLG